MFNFDEANRKSKEAMDSMLKNYSEVTKGFQAIAAEASDFSKKSFQDMGSFMEQLTTVKSAEAAFELQQSYMKSSYEAMVAQATKMSEMYAELAKTMYRPYEGAMNRAAQQAQAPAQYQ